MSSTTLVFDQFHFTIVFKDLFGLCSSRTSFVSVSGCQKSSVIAMSWSCNDNNPDMQGAFAVLQKLVGHSVVMSWCHDDDDPDMWVAFTVLQKFVGLSPASSHQLEEPASFVLHLVNLFNCTFLCGMCHNIQLLACLFAIIGLPNLESL